MWETILSDNSIELAQLALSGIYLAVIVAGVVLCMLNYAWSSGDRDGFRNLAVGAFAFFAEYVVASGILFGLDRYDPGATSLLIDALNLILYLVLRGIYLHREPGMDWDIREYGGVLLLCVVGLLLIHEKNEFYGMQQDQGVYQTEAIALLSGSNENQKKIEEYEILTDEDQERFSHYMQSALNGFYFYSDNWEDYYATEFETESSGYFHGVHTLSALLALWGSVFGVSGMSGIQDVFLCILLALSYCIMRRMGCAKWLALSGTAVVMLVPEIVWVGKSALTEMFLACVIALFVNLLLYEDRTEVGYSVLAIWGFCFIHITCTLVLPIFILVYMGFFLKTRYPRYLLAGGAAAAGYGLAMTFHSITATQYFYINFRYFIEKMSFLKLENVMTYIWVICGVTMAAFLVLFLLRSKLPVRRASDDGQEEELPRQPGTAAKWIVRVLALLALILFVIVAIHYLGNHEDAAFSDLTLVTEAYMTGFLLLPMVLVLLIARPAALFEHENGAFLLTMFLYCVILYGLFFRPAITNYYYLGRYLTPFIPIIVWMAAYLTGGLRVRWMPGACWAAEAVSVAIFVLPNDLMLCASQDDTRLEWTVLEGICDQIEPEDVVIVSDELLNTCYLPVKYLTGATVIPQFEHPAQEQMETYASEEGHTYFLSEGGVTIDGLTVVWRESNTVSEDTESAVERNFMGLPITLAQTTETIQLSERKSYQYYYTAEDDDVWINMGEEENGGRWGYGESYGLYAVLEPNQYTVTVRQAEIVPLATYGVDTYPVTVYVNGTAVLQLEIQREYGLDPFKFTIPAQYIVDGTNEIRFVSSPWYPLDLGTNDYRSLGFNIKSIRFTTE